jgi:hypothetical protein
MPSRGWWGARRHVQLSWWGSVLKLDSLGRGLWVATADW